MTFVLHRGERADVLAAVLAGVLSVPLDDPFRPEVVAVHSRGVERWLAHRLSHHLGAGPGGDGVCANLGFPFPGALVGRALARATGVEPADDPWRPERLAWPLLEVVDAHLDRPWLHVLAGHLGGADADARRDRRFAAVRHLADLFDGYAVHRPAMVRAWAEGADRYDDGEPLPRDAQWQATLWRLLREHVGAPSPAERLVDGCAAIRDDPALVDLPERLSLFGFTRLPGSYLDVLDAIAVHRDVHLLALHPSPAAWTTVASVGEFAVRHPLLRSWGRDSREMQLVLDERLNPDVEVRHHPTPADEPTTLLQCLQAGLRADAPPRAPVPLAAGDRSVQVHACHGRARQAEVVRDAITHLLADDPTLEPRDVVVLCPDIDEFAPLLHAAFDDRGRGDGPPPIRYQLADRSLRQTNPVLGALAELLDLAEARLTASEVLGFAALGPVRTRFGLDDDSLERLGEWIGATGIRWGLDATHRVPFDLGAVDAGTWREGLRRLLLGVAMSEDGQRLVDGVLPLDDVDGGGEIDLAGRLAELVERIATVVATLQGPQPIADWVAALGAAADLLFDTRAADAWQRSQLDRLLVEVDGEARGGTAPLRLAEVRDLLADRLRGQPTRAAFRTGDLTMCTLVPMRSVPHRVVCLVGLDDGAFPRSGAPDGDDLLARRRRPGDHDRRAEDRQLLLDAVLAARDALVITYAGRDPRTNEVLPPAVPVNELLDLVDATVAGADGTSGRGLVVHHHPLQPADARCFEPGRLGHPEPWGFDPALLAGAQAAAAARPRPAAFLDGPLPPVVQPTIALDDLVAFVQHPVKAFLRQRLELSLRRDDDRPIDGLPVELDELASWGVADRLLALLLAGADPARARAAERARGLLPPGRLGEGALDAAVHRADTVARAARQAAAGDRTALEIDVALPDGRRLVGSVPDVVGDVLRPASVSAIGPKHRLAAWVRLLAATAAHRDRTLRSSLVGWQSRTGTAAVETLAPLPADAALGRLLPLVGLLDRGRCEPLPLACRASAEWVRARRLGEDPEEAARRSWTTGGGDWRKEDRDPEHVLVHGADLPFARLLDEPPAPGEDGPGWATDEDTRFGRLARRLWDPLLDHGR